VGKPEGRRPLGRPRRRWEDNIRRDLQQLLRKLSVTHHVGTIYIYIYIYHGMG
jgi:hypothetical protein